MTAATQARTTPAQPVTREETALQHVTVKMKRLLAAAIDKRFLKRYDLDAPGDESDFLFEMEASMNLFLARLPFLPAVCKTDVMADRVRALVKDKVIDLMTAMAGECAPSTGPSPVVSPTNRGASANAAGRERKKRVTVENFDYAL